MVHPGESFLTWKMGGKIPPGLPIDKVDRICEKCSITFLGYKHSRFCSPECRFIPAWIPHNDDCILCGMSFLKKVANQYCCPRCPHEGRDYVRNLVRLRDNYTCQDCGEIRTLNEVRTYNQKITTLKGKLKSFDVHHLHGLCGKKTKGYDSKEEMNTMITLCHRCHFNRPEHRAKSKKHG